MTYRIEQRIVPGSGGGSRGSAWRAVSGEYEATSRSGAPFALARVMVAAGCEAAPVEVYTDDYKGCMRYRSLHWMATRTIEESDRPLTNTRYQERGQDIRERGQNRGESGSDDVG